MLEKINAETAVMASPVKAYETIPDMLFTLIEAYSWGVGEDESGDGLYCGFEGVVGAAVIGV